MNIFKKILKWLSIILAVFIVALFVLTSFVINHYKGAVEHAITNQFGIEANIEGKMQLKILPGFSLVVNKLNLINNETYFLRTESAEFTIDFQSFIFGQKNNITAIRLNKPQVFIYKNENQKFNFEPNSESVKIHGSSLNYNITALEINEGRLIYFDAIQKDTLLISGISLSSNQVRATGNFENFSLKNSFFEGNLTIGNLKLNALNLRNIQLKITENNEQILIEPKVTEFYGGILSGKASTDLSQVPTETKINFTATNVKMDSLLMDFETALYLKGKMNLSADIQFNSFDWNQAKHSTLGNIVLSGENVTVYGFNTDVVLRNYTTTGKFSAINAGAALMAGPLGAIFTNNKGLASLLTYDSGDSLIAKHYFSKWEFSQGDAFAEDVAFSDGKYRIAVSGAVDCQNRSYKNLIVSLIDAGGCPLLSQNISGIFQDAQFETVSNIDAKNKSKTEIIQVFSSRKSCQFPYKGSVLAP